MKKGKIILGAAAALVTVGSSLAFKVAHKFAGGARVFALTANSAQTVCPVTCFSLRTVSSDGTQFTTCITAAAPHRNLGVARNGNTFFKAVGSARTCVNPVTKLQKAP